MSPWILGRERDLGSRLLLGILSGGLDLSLLTRAGLPVDR